LSEDGIVIIGAGQGGFQLARSLREAKFTGSIRLVGDERHLPYQRPPLSKAYLSGEACLDQVLLCGKSSFDSRSEVVPGLVEVEVAVPRSRPAVW
jgi:3-phenylpropionate/trans-cinnamate dioxygenase ferredoxin reductase component